MAKPKEFFLGISDTNTAHIAKERRYASDYHLVEHRAYMRALKALIVINETYPMSAQCAEVAFEALDDLGEIAHK